MTAATFQEKIIVLHEWNSGFEHFRLVDKGAGPTELQIKLKGEWVPENERYVHGVLTNCISNLSKQIETRDEQIEKAIGLLQRWAHYATLPKESSLRTETEELISEANNEQRQD